MKNKVSTGVKRFGGKASAMFLVAAVSMMVMASSASAAIDVDKLTEPVQDEVDANLPKLLLFIGTILAIGFVVGWAISMLKKGKRG